jgi:hypothetical protein
VNDEFTRLYSRDEPIFGDLHQKRLWRTFGGRADAGALDLGAGLGRNAIALALHGFIVTADRWITSRTEKIANGSRSGRFTTQSSGGYRIAADAVAAVAGLDSRQCALCRSTYDPGHTGVDQRASVRPQSSTTFHRNELFAILRPWVRVLRYEEKLEWDNTHGEIMARDGTPSPAGGRDEQRMPRLAAVRKYAAERHCAPATLTLVADQRIMHRGGGRALSCQMRRATTYS